MKIKFSWLWLVFFPIFYIAHLHKVLFFLFLIMSIHESMHVICALKLGYRIEKVVVYPFGLSASILHFEYKNSWHEIWITLSGLSVHILAAFFIPLLSLTSFCSQSFISYMENANMALFFFNCLPIYPLDGGRIIRNIIEFCFPFKKAKLLSMLFSVVCFVFILKYLSFNDSQKLLFIMLFLFQYIILLKEYKQDIHDFYLYRYFHTCIKKLKIHHENDIYKNRCNCFIKNGQIRNEKDVLHEWI